MNSSAIIIENEQQPFQVMSENVLYSSNKKPNYMQGSSAKNNSSSQSGKKKSGMMSCSSYNKENSNTAAYVREGNISLHFNSKSEMVVHPFANQNHQTRQQHSSNKQMVSNHGLGIEKTADKMQSSSTLQQNHVNSAAISIEMSPDWAVPSSKSPNVIEKMDIQEEENPSQYMTSSGIARSELQKVVRNLNLIDLAKIEDEPTPLSSASLNLNGGGFSNCSLGRGDSTTSDQFLREISTNILNTNSSNDFITLDKKQKFYKKCNYDRFIPSRVESDTYKFFLASNEPKKVEYDQYGNQMHQSNGNNSSAFSNSNNGMREEYNRQLYHNLLHAHFLESNTTVTQSTHSAADDTSLFLSHSESASKQKAFKPLKKLFSYGDSSISQTVSSSTNCVSSTSLIPSSSTSSSSKKSSIFPSLINLPDSNNYIDDTPKLKINPRPYKILEAPTLKNDFYLNLLDWSASNLVSVGLENYVYVLSGANQSVKTQFTIPEYIDPNMISMQRDQDNGHNPSDYYNMVCSVGWSQRSDHIAVGDRQGKVYLFDLQKNKFLRVMHNHKGRVGQIAWNGHLIATGSRDKNILITDVRDKNPHSMVFEGHEQEICGMRWSFDEQTLASGGNDNKVFLWSLKMNGNLAKISQSKAAVKAIGFSPHQHNILAFGGGTADRCIRIYDTQQLKQIDCIDTGSQVCNLIFSKNSRQIISTHGYSLNQIIVWNQSNMKKIATLTGHSQRVLYLAESPCGQNILTGAADETIRFWNIFKNDIVNELSPSSLGLR